MLNSSIVDQYTTETTIPTKMSTALPNDDCESTFKLETEFLTKYLPQQYVYNQDNTSTIITSRALKTSYIWPKNKPITINDLSIFAENGHTLGIDYQLTYIRMFALDLDCSCRKTGSNFEHINENIVTKVIQHLTKLIEEVLGVNRIEFSVWRNNCGFHIYTDLMVSMPTHLFLKKQLETKIDFIAQPIIFEVPNIMPLPYSAKRMGYPYKLLYINENMNNIPLTNYNEFNCLELFIFQQIPLDGRTVANITSIMGTEFLVKNKTPIYRRNNPKIVNVSSVTLYDNFSYMTQFENYIKLMVSQYNTHITKIDDIDFSDITEDERVQIQTFMGKINKLFGTHGSESCDLFIKLSALDFGGLYLQPFTAALFLDLQSTDIIKFKSILKKIYKSAMNQYAAIKVFVNLVNIQTFHAYSEETSDSIIEHLHFLISHNALPTQTLDQQINSIMEKMTDTQADSVRAILNKCDKNRLELIINELIRKFKKIFFEMKILYYDQSSSRYYFLNPMNGAAYESCSKLTVDMYPSVVRRWIGYSSIASNIFKQVFEQSHDMHLIDPINFTQSTYMYSTKVGVFNSAVGLYTAHTRFLRFYKFRNTSIWPYNVPEKLFYAQNESIIEHYDVVTKFVSIIQNDLFKLYTHCVFAPAMIQLRNLISIEERFIYKIFSSLADHKNFESAHFLIEYFQFDPKIIYLLIHICNEYGGLEILYSYQTMCSKIFQSNSISPLLWREKFQSVIDHAHYDATKPTYIEKLMSLHGEHIESVPTSTYLFIVIILACMIKCDAYNDFILAFNITLPDKINHHELYTEFDCKTTMASMRSNFNRARDIVFGKNRTPFQDTLIDELFSICMSANFKPETVINYLTAVSAMFIPVNVSKKLTLLQGDGDVGKSLACKKIAEIAAPSVGRFEDVSSLMNRASPAEYSVIIINEAARFNSSHIRIITGNDDTSMKRFFTQSYELQRMQTLMFGATNIHVSFKGSDREDVDKTSVSRLYAILFTGKQCPAETHHSSLISMLANETYFSGLLVPIMSDSVNALRWLSFGIYMSVRDINYYPKLNTDCDACRDYQHTVHYYNSKLYKFIVDSGLIDAPGFFISKEKLLSIVKPNIDKNGKYSSISAFKSDFEKQYNISFDKIKDISNFQQIGLIQHIIDNMMVVEEEGSQITADDIKKKLEVYTLMEHCDNARSYFQRTQEKYYDYQTGVYKNIAFASNVPQSYDGNESPSNTTSISRDSLVMKSV